MLLMFYLVDPLSVVATAQVKSFNVKIMKRIKLQLVFATIFTLCSFLLVCMMFIYMYEYQGSIDRTHVIMGIMFSVVSMMSARILCQVAQEYHECKNEIYGRECN